MNFSTVSFDRVASADERTAVEAAVRARGGTIAWRTSTRCSRTYGLASFPAKNDAEEIAAVTPATVYGTAIIALALYPAVAEALPYLLEALGGQGRPTGVFSCSPCPDGVVVEWDPARSKVATVFHLADAELARFGGGRTAELLSPLPPDVVAGVASDGLQAPEIAPGRELETLLQQAGLQHA